MATAGLDTVTVEIEFTAGVWTDVSAWVRWDQRVKARYGRASRFSDVSASTLDLVLRNEGDSTTTAGRFTPDNPLSAYWPNITENKRIRVTGTRGTSGYRIFTGYIAAWTPQFPTGDTTSGAVVEVSAVDILGQLDRHILQAEYVEKALSLARSAATWVDVYGFDDADGVTSLRNGGAIGGTSTLLGTGTVIPFSSTKRRGSYTINSGDSDLLLAGYITLSPSGTAGPVVRVQPPAFGVKTLDAWVRFPVTTLPAPGVPLRVMDAWLSATTRVCSLSLVNVAGSVNLQLLDDSGASLGTVDTAVNDGTWRKLTLASNSGTPSSLDVSVDDVAALSAVASTDLRSVWRFYFGGACSPLIEGKNTSCTGMDLAGIVLTPGATATAAGYARATSSVASTTRFADFLAYISGYYTGGGTEGADDRLVWRTDTTDRTVLDCLQELARTIGGVVWQTPGGTLKLYLPDQINPTVPLASIDVEKDADIRSGPPQWQRAVDTIPTRATVSSPVGSATAVNAAAEAAGGRRDVSVSSCAASLTDAASLGAAQIKASPSLRLAQLSADLVTATNDLWDSLLTAGNTAPVLRGYTETPDLAVGAVTAPLPAGTVAGDLVMVFLHNVGTGSTFSVDWTFSFDFQERAAYKLVTAADVTNGYVSFNANTVRTSGSKTALVITVKTGTFNAAAPVAVVLLGDNTGVTAPTSAGTVNVVGIVPAAAYSLMLWSVYTSSPVTLSISSSTGSAATLLQQWSVDAAATLAFATSTWGSVGSSPSNQDIHWTWTGSSMRVGEARAMVSGALDVVNLRPGVRLRVTNLPTRTFGASYTDALVEGWALDLAPDACVLTFDTSPADDPVPGVVGDAEYGRAGAVSMTVTSGTAVATTAVGTLVLTTAGGNPALTVDATAFPLDLNWNGERVTVTAAPGSSTTPQTVTLTARGVAPTIARTHATGETVDIWHSAAAPL